MWGFASKAINGTSKLKNNCSNPSQALSECSDDEPPLNSSREEGLECPICWDSFNIVENVPYILWCGHTLCKNCVLGLQTAVVKLPTLPIQLPFFITCPWCSQLSIRLVYKGNLRFPCKNYFLLWMVESMNGDWSKSCFSVRGDHHQLVDSSNRNVAVGNRGSQTSSRRALEQAASTRGQSNNLNARYINGERIQISLCKSLAFFVHLTAKFPLIVVFLVVVLYIIPVSAAILALYIVITVVFAVPCFLILYFAFPSLDWLVREIIT